MLYDDLDSWNALAAGDTGIDALNHLELLEQPEIAVYSAAWFRNNRGVNNEADHGSYRSLTLRINAKVLGYKERGYYRKRAVALLTRYPWKDWPGLSEMGSWTRSLRRFAHIHNGVRIAVLAAAWVGFLPTGALSRTDAAPAAMNEVVAPCDQPGTTGIDVVVGTRFNVNLPPFGRVCFLARRHLANLAEHETDLIGFELWRDGARVYSLPMPPGYLWNELCKKILAVGFSHRGEQTDIIVLGSCMTAGRDDLSQPLIFSSQPGGFRFDDDLSEATIGFDTIKQVQRKIDAVRKGEH